MSSSIDNFSHQNDGDIDELSSNTDNRPRLECNFCKTIVLKHNLKSHLNTKKCKSFQLNNDSSPEKNIQNSLIENQEVLNNNDQKNEDSSIEKKQKSNRKSRKQNSLISSILNRLCLELTKLVLDIKEE